MNKLKLTEISSPLWFSVNLWGWDFKLVFCPKFLHRADSLFSSKPVSRQKNRRQGLFRDLMSQEWDVENDMPLGEGQDNYELWCQFNQWQRNLIQTDMEAFCSYLFYFLYIKNIDLSTKMLGLLVGERDCKKLGSGWDSVNSLPTLSQPGPFQNFAYRAGTKISIFKPFLWSFPNYTLLDNNLIVIV